MKDYSIKEISPKLMEDVREALSSVPSFGSVEIYIQNGFVTQISVRHIKKTSIQTSEIKTSNGHFQDNSVST